MKNISKLIIKAQKKIDKEEYSEFKFVREYQKGVIAFYQMVFEMIMYGVIEKIGGDVNKLFKSITIKDKQWEEFFKSEHIEDNKNTELIKSLLSNIKKKVGFVKKLWIKFGFGRKGWMGKIDKKKLLKPMEIKGKFVYDTKGKLITNKEWKSLEDSIVEYLDASNIEEEIVIRGALFGKLVQRMDKENIPRETQRQLSFDDITNIYKEIPNSIKDSRKWFTDNQMKAVEYAKQNSLKYLAVKDGEVKQQMLNIYKDTITEGIKNRWTQQELSQALFWTDPSSEFGKIYKPKSIEILNRNWERIAKTETAIIMNNSYLEAMLEEATEIEKEEGQYFVFSGGIKYSKVYTKPTMSLKQYQQAKHKAFLEQKKTGKRTEVKRSPSKSEKVTCEWCEGWIGILVKLIDETPKSGKDIIKDDPYGAKFYIWPGKSNVGRNTDSWWIAFPVHPHCQHYPSKINPKIQSYDKESKMVKMRKINNNIGV